MDEFRVSRKRMTLSRYWEAFKNFDEREWKL